MTVMELSDDEVQLVLRERARMVEVYARIDKQKSCEHHWAYRGEWRGSSHYECFECGATMSD